MLKGLGGCPSLDHTHSSCFSYSDLVEAEKKTLCSIFLIFFQLLP